MYTDRLRYALFLALILTIPMLGSTTAETDPPDGNVRIEEVVTSPQRDRDGNGRISDVDELIVLRNLGTQSVTLDGWRLVMEDTTPAEQVLEGALAPGGRKIVVNPTGALNNDVLLSVYDPADTLVDQVHLGTDAPDGRATGIIDEAVHLIGAWQGTKGPATEGNGLPPVWVEWVAAEATAPAEPFEAGWLPAGPTSLYLRLHQAPDIQPTLGLLVDDTNHPLQEDGDLHRADVPAFAADTVSLGITVDGSAFPTWPDGTAMRFPVDRLAPRIIGDPEAVLNETRHLHWTPAASDPESGLQEVWWEAVGTNESWRLQPCMVPDEGASSCPLPQNVTAIRLHASDHGGNAATADLTLRTDTAPAEMPYRFLFETGVPPTVSWPAFTEPLSLLHMETADDASGTYHRNRTTLQPTTTTFTDHAWVPGSPRAYRLVATDRAGHTSAGPWVALPPEAVPVASRLAGLENVIDRLLDRANATVTGSFDRPLEEVPALVLDVGGTRPYRLVLDGALAPDGQSASWVATAEGFPRSGIGRWSFAGGGGSDGAPIAALDAPAVWDHEPPRIELGGVTDDWIRSGRHAVTVSARDLGTEPPLIEIATVGAETSAQPGRIDLLFQQEGAHPVVVQAHDAAGNQAERRFLVRLDATPPRVSLAPMPQVWSADAPIRLSFEDNASGTATDSLDLVVRSPDGEVTPTAYWNGSQASFVPNGPPLNGPFELHLQVEDRAGNRAAGLLGVRLAQPSRPVEVVLNGTTTANGTATPPTDTASLGSGGLGAPVVTEAEAQWVDDTEEPLAAAHAPDDEGGSSLTSWIVAFLGAGVVGLGTMVRRRKLRRPVGRTASTEDPPERPRGDRPDDPGPTDPPSTNGIAAAPRHRRAPPADDTAPSATRPTLLCTTLDDYGVGPTRESPRDGGGGAQEVAPGRWIHGSDAGVSTAFRSCGGTAEPMAGCGTAAGAS